MEEIFDGSAAVAAPAMPDSQAPPAEQTPDVQQQADPPALDASKGQPQAENPDAGKETGAPPAPESQDGQNSAYGRLRKERNESREQLMAEKVERARIEERLAAVQRQLEAFEAKKEQPSQPLPPPNVLEDPYGYQAHQQTAMQQSLFNERLNMSEAIVRSQHDSAEIDAALDAFKEAVRQNPALGAQLSRESHPYGWAYQEGKRLQALKEIGTDPAAYRAKVEAEILARVEAERAAASPPATRSSVPPNLPPSLGKVANAGARMGTGYTGPTPIENLFG
jgi:hypothetical protein